MDVKFFPCGEAALRFLVDQTESEEQWRIVHRVAEWLLANPVTGVHGVVPTYDSLLVEFDATLQTFDTLAPLLRLMVRDALNANEVELRPARRFMLPVVYGGEYGPDLEFVAGFLDLTEQQVIDLHTADDRIVRCLGGPAASCMIDGPPFRRPIPRLATPRLEVPANAVSVAGRQGVIGPVRAPSGWRLIGGSPVEVMDTSTESLVPYRPGDIIRFRPIAAAEWNDYAGTHLWQLTD